MARIHVILARYTLKTLKHPPSDMVWGFFIAYGRGALHFMEKRQKVNSEVYIDILNDKLKHFMCVAGTNIFQQDNTPCHTARTIIKWLADNDIELLDWPGNSPDINRIETLWSIIKARMQEGIYEGIPQLKAALSRFWCLEVTREV